MFGQAKLGDVRRTRRVISMTTAVALRPGGTIAKVFDNPAELVGAYDLVENEAVDPEELTDCLARHGAELARPFVQVRVATDGTSQTVSDRSLTKGTGRVSTTRSDTDAREVFTEEQVEGVRDLQKLRVVERLHTARAFVCVVERITEHELSLAKPAHLNARRVRA